MPQKLILLILVIKLFNQFLNRFLFLGEALCVVRSSEEFDNHVVGSTGLKSGRIMGFS